MTRIRLAGLMLALLLAASIVGCTPPKAQDPSIQYYTAYNMWYEHPRKMFAINYKKGTLIPAGTPIQELAYTGKAYLFKIDGEDYRIIFKRAWHPGETTETYKDRVFTTKTFDELSRGVSTAAMNAIKGGYLRGGMTKDEVILAWGYPPEHKTPSLDSNRWLYWENRWVSTEVCFQNGRSLKSCP